MGNLACAYREHEEMDFEMRRYKEHKRRQQEEEYKTYIRNQRVLGVVLIAASILLFPLHKEGMVVTFCGMLGIMPWIPEKRR